MTPLVFLRLSVSPDPKDRNWETLYLVLQNTCSRQEVITPLPNESMIILDL